MDKSIFNRTVKTNIVIYPTDGMGRDGYITYNNAGFWKENIKQIYPKNTYGRKPFATFKSLRRIPPSWKYHSDGTGRDTYVLYNYGGLIKKFVPAYNNYDLRTSEEIRRSPQKIALSRAEKLYNQQISTIQKNLVNRLYERYRDKIRKKNLCKSNSTNFLLKETSPYKSFEPGFPQDNYNTLLRSGSQDKIINNNLNDFRTPFYQEENHPYKAFDYGMNYRTNQGNTLGEIGKETLSSSLPKYNSRNERVLKGRNDFKRYRVKVLSNSLDKRNERYPFINSPKNQIESDLN